MNKAKNIIWFVSVLALFGLSVWLYVMSKKQTNEIQPVYQPMYSESYEMRNSEFSDGLTKPDSVTTYETNEFGEGISEKAIYYVDINGDKLLDRITRTLFETGNAHSYYKYKIELNRDNKYVDITPGNLQTTHGADCDLELIQFAFKPQFKITLIYRNLGETWSDPTMAHKKTFTMFDNKIREISDKEMRVVCDVKELF